MNCELYCFAPNYSSLGDSFRSLGQGILNRNVDYINNILTKKRRVKQNTKGNTIDCLTCPQDLCLLNNGTNLIKLFSEKPGNKGCFTNPRVTDHPHPAPHRVLLLHPNRAHDSLINKADPVTHPSNTLVGGQLIWSLMQEPHRLVHGCNWLITRYTGTATARKSS